MIILSMIFSYKYYNTILKSEIHLSLITKRSGLPNYLLKYKRKMSLCIPLIIDHQDCLIITETWLLETDPDIIKMSIAPPSFNVLHAFRTDTGGLYGDGRQNKTQRIFRGGKNKNRPNKYFEDRGGGVAFIYRDTLTVTKLSTANIPMDSYEILLMHVNGVNRSLRLAAIYCYSSWSLPPFLKEFPHLLDHLQ